MRKTATPPTTLGQDLLNAVKENEVIREVQQLINTTGLNIQRINTGAFFTGEGKNRRFVRSCKKGTLDFEGYDNHGRFLAIECKRPIGGRLTKEQTERINDINAKGGVAFIATSEIEALRLLKENNCL